MNSERRFLLFLMLAMAILTGHMVLVQFLSPPKPPVAQKEPAADKKQPDPNEKTARPGEGPLAPEVGKPEVAGQPPGENNGAEGAPVHPSRWVSLGSLAAEDGFRLLATFTSRGAAIERIELADPAYHDLEDPSGYLGQLALTEGERGCVVNAVGAGTPASAAVAAEASQSAGLKAGDVIVAFAGQPTPNTARFEELRKATQPGEEIALEVERGSGPKLARLVFTLTAGVRPLEIVRPEESSFQGQIEQHPLSLLLALAPGPAPAGQAVDMDARDAAAEKLARLMHQGHWSTAEIGGEFPGVEFRLKLPVALLRGMGCQSPVEVVKRYRVSRDYHLEFDVEFVNQGTEPLPLAYRLDGPTGLPLEGWWYSSKVGGANDWSRFGPRDVVWRPLRGSPRIASCAAITSAVLKNEFRPHPLTATETTDLRYAGVDAQYFAVVLRARGAEDASYSFTHVDGLPVNRGEAKQIEYSHTADVSFRLTSAAFVLPAGEKLQHQFEVFAGPKDRNLLETYRLSELVRYGWWWWVSPAILFLLRVFYFLVGNYGVAIVLLTVVVRLALFPISLRAMKDAEKMKLIQPELHKMREKYKSDNDKLIRAQQELFRKYNYNPLSGCLPLFLQLPVFAGLYRALTVDIALRQAPLIPGAQWCSNLAGPDKLFYWEPYLWTSLGGPLGWFGPYFNVFPLITVVLFLINQKMVLPPPTDEQQRMQQSVMLYTTMFMGILFFKVPSGLCIYFIASSLWGIMERKFLIKPPAAAAAPAK